MIRLSIRVKAALLLVTLATLPALLVAQHLQTVNRAAIESSERNLQASVLAEVAASMLGLVRETESDAKAVAAALALAAKENDRGLEPVRALIATRKTIDAARFEVPAAGVDTVIRRAGATTEAPRSTPELRREADERGVAFRVGVVVVPVQRAHAEGAAGYVTVRVDLSRLSSELERLAETRFADGPVSLLVADGERRAVAVHAVDGVSAGSDVSQLPIWSTLPAGAPSRARVAVVSEFADRVGGVQSVEELGWAVALWRPRAVAYRSLEEMQRQTLFAVIVVVVVALGIGLALGEAITRPVLGLARQARRIGQRRWRELEPAAARRDEIGELDRAMTEMARDLEQGEQELERETKLRGDLGRFMSQELVEAIVRGDHALTLGGERREITVLFADVVAFTPLAEQKGAEDVVKILNELFSLLSEIVFKHGGTVDKFIGDCLMAVWGAPVTQADHARRALSAAEDMLRFLETANRAWSERHGVEIRLAIGVNSGEAIVGNIGSDKRMEYTVVGDIVNVAARLEAIAKPNQILCTERTAELAGEGFTLRSLGAQQLTGRKGTTTVLELRMDDDA
jgi:class 3 adenylate cyclase